jgi:hypothetical protein
MTHNLSAFYAKKWLLTGLTTLILLILVLSWIQVTPAYACYPNCAPSPTPTPTQTPLPPPPQACQITGIFFDDQPYSPGATVAARLGVPLKVTLRVADAQGAPLIGANVDATMTQTNSVQAAAIPPLEDQSGTYDAVYTPQNAGTYLIKFSVSDFIGPRFLPCSAEAKVQVEDLPACDLTVTPSPGPYLLNQPLTLTATVRVGGQEQCQASVSGSATKPDQGSDPLSFGGSCPYLSNYTPTQSGNYTFTVTAADSAQPPRFRSCEAILTPPPIIVEPPVTSTLTPTLLLELPPSPIDLCGRGPDITGTVAVSNVTGLTGVQLTVDYAPDFIQVIDALGRPRPPVQVRPDPNFDLFLLNNVNLNQGIIFFNANARTPITGRSNVIYVDWRLQGRTGTTPITVQAMLTDTTGTHTLTQVISPTIIIDSICTQGTVNLQGRADHSGVTVSAPSGQQTWSYPTGLFAIPPADPLSFTFPGYLSAQLTLPQGTAASLTPLTLLAGDVNGDSAINILDLAYLAQHYQSADPVADLNADGIVNILDLALVAGNYQQQGPLTTWK